MGFWSGLSPPLKYQTYLLLIVRLKDTHTFSNGPPQDRREGWNRVLREWQNFNSLLLGKSSNLEDSFAQYMTNNQHRARSANSHYLLAVNSSGATQPLWISVSRCVSGNIL